MNDVERWRPIPGYEETYSVSSQGRVWSFPRYGTIGGLLRPSVHPHGYLKVNLHQDSVGRTWCVHALVCLAFLGPRPEGKQVRHLDGDPSNSTLANLTYGTPTENGQDSVRHGTNSGATKTRCKRGHDITDPANIYLAPATASRKCRTCKRINGANASAAAARRLAEDPNVAEHGKANTYDHYRCRCDPCKAAKVRQTKARRARAGGAAA